MIDDYPTQSALILALALVSSDHRQIQGLGRLDLQPRLGARAEVAGLGVLQDRSLVASVSEDRVGVESLVLIKDEIGGNRLQELLLERHGLQQLLVAPGVGRVRLKGFRQHIEHIQDRLEPAAALLLRRRDRVRKSCS